jgi:Fe2+ or Zn2+ uptake regulation protein
MLKYKIERRIRPSKKMTEAMVDMVEYIKANPGTRRKELYDKMLGGRLISPSSIGSNLKLLLDRKIIRTNNAQTQNRKFFYIEAIK